MNLWHSPLVPEKFFKMKKSDCKEALEIYKRFLTRVTKIGEFMKLAEVSSNYSLHRHFHTDINLGFWILLCLCFHRQSEWTKMTFLTSTMWVIVYKKSCFLGNLLLYCLEGWWSRTLCTWTPSFLIYTLTQTQPDACASPQYLPTQCLHPGVVVDLADSDDEDCPFTPLEDPVTTETKGCPGWVPV